MSNLQRGARVGAATIVVGFSLAWPQAAGVASADKPDQDSPSVSAGPTKSGSSSARAPRSNAARPSDKAQATAAKGRAAATSAASAHSSAAARLGPTAKQTRRLATESAIADAVPAALANTPPDPASTAGTTTASAAVATVAVTTTPKVAASNTAAAVPSPTNKLGTLTVPRANDVVSTITNLFSGLVGSIQSFVEGVGLLVRRFLFNQAPTVLAVQTSGQTTGQSTVGVWSTITGSLNAVDPEDDTITYSVVQPDHGTVTIDSNGNYTYVPTTGPGGFTGTDTFTVTATDTGLHINLLNLGRAPSTQAIVSVTQTTGDPRVGYTFVFGDGGRYWSSEARAALETTANDLSSYFIVSNAVIITYSVTGQRTLVGSTLASAGSDLVSTLPGFYDTVVQRKILTGGVEDANGSAADGEIDWNFGYSWALGNSVASNQYDFQSTAMHELLHSYGFLSVVDSAGNNTGKNWTTYDSFVVAKTSNGTVAPIDHTTYAWNTDYNTNLTGGANGLYFGGMNAKAAYGGNPVPLYTPKPWEPGSSMSHLDDFTFTGLNAKLMNAVSDTGLGIRTLSGVEIGILRDLGYNVANTPQTLAIFIIGFTFIRRRKRNAEFAAA